MMSAPKLADGGLDREPMSSDLSGQNARNSKRSNAASNNPKATTSNTMISWDQADQQSKTSIWRSHLKLPLHLAAIIMEPESKYSLGYTHGVEQARPIVDLEHRVNKVEGSLKAGKWILGITAIIVAISTLAKLPIIRNILGRKEDKDGGKKDEHKEKPNWKRIIEEGRKNNTTEAAGKKVRRHAREFIVSQNWW